MTIEREIDQYLMDREREESMQEKIDERVDEMLLNEEFGIRELMEMLDESQEIKEHLYRAVVGDHNSLSYIYEQLKARVSVYAAIQLDREAQEAEEMRHTPPEY